MNIFNKFNAAITNGYYFLVKMDHDYTEHRDFVKPPYDWDYDRFIAKHKNISSDNIVPCTISMYSILQSSFGQNLSIFKNIYNYLFRPSAEVEQIISESKISQELNNSVGYHIRVGNVNGDSSPIPFASDNAVESFLKDVEDNVKNGVKVFLATDNIDVRQRFVKKFGENGKDILFHEGDVGHVGKIVNRKTIMDGYVEWFMLSMCKKIYVTAGGTHNLNILNDYDQGMFSTFGLTASIYNGSYPYYVFNDGKIFFADMNRKNCENARFYLLSESPR